MENITIQEMLFQTFIEIIIYILIGVALIGKNIKISGLLLVTIIMTLISYYTSDIITYFNIFVFLLSFVLTLYLFSDFTIIEVILVVLFGYMIKIINKILFTPILFKLKELICNNFIYSFFEKITYYLPEEIIILVLFLVLKKYKISLLYWNHKLKLQYCFKESNDDYIRKLWPLIISLFLPIIFLYSYNLSLQESLKGRLDEYYIVLIITINATLVFLLIILSIFLLNKFTKLRGLEFIERKTSENLHELFLSYRQQRHDFNNHLQTVYGLIEMKDFNGAKAYFEKTFSNIVEKSEFFKLNNNVLTALLYAKIGIAKSKHISINILVNSSSLTLH